MPELPEVETVRRGLEHVSLGLAVTGGEVLYPRTIAYPSDAQHFLVGLQSKAIAHWQRRGKYLLAQLTQPAALGVNPSRGDVPVAQGVGWLAVHLRMTGQLLWLNPKEPVHKHTRVRLFFGNRQELRFVDQRTFGQMWWVAPEQAPEQVISGLNRLGPEPFSEEFSVAYLRYQLRHRQRPVKNALLDQQIIAGIGNIYADETLFRSGIRPTTLCCRLRPQQVKQIHVALIQVLESSLAQGGTTFSHFRNVLGINGNYAGVAWVYGRAGEACRTCGQTIERIKLAGRSTHFCPRCQC